MMKRRRLCRKLTSSSTLSKRCSGKQARLKAAASRLRLCRRSDSLKVLELEEQLKFVGAQLEEVRAEQAALAVALAAAERKFAEQQEPLPQRQEDRKARRIPEPVVVAETVAAPRAKSSKPLPHELRPAPKKGALFRPDWDLQGLPCQSSEQVYKAWESAFNVQISLEGYTSQYCMAFLVVLRLGKQKRLYMLYRLKQDKHTLVCVPSESSR